MFKLLFTVVILLTYNVHAKIINLNLDNTVISSPNIDVQSYDKDISSLLYKVSTTSTDEPIYFILFSNGGSVQLANVLITIINAIPNVYVVCLKCESAAASMFLQANNKIAISNSKLMTHEMKYFLTPDNLLLMCEKKEEIIQAEDTFNTIFYTKLKMTKEKYKEKIKDTAWYLDTTSLLKYKIVTEVITVSCDKEIQHIMPETCKNGQR